MKYRLGDAPVAALEAKVSRLQAEVERLREQHLEDTGKLIDAGVEREHLRKALRKAGGSDDDAT